MPQHEDSDGDIKGSENKPNTLNEQMTACVCNFHSFNIKLSFSTCAFFLNINENVFILSLPLLSK